MRGRHSLHLKRECHKFPRREIAFTELNRRRHGIHHLLQKWNQRTPIGLVAIRDDKKTAGECRHQQSIGSGVRSGMLKTFRLLTRPTLAHRDAPFPKRGRSERRNEVHAAVR